MSSGLIRVWRALTRPVVVVVSTSPPALPPLVSVEGFFFLLSVHVLFQQRRAKHRCAGAPMLHLGSTPVAHRQPNKPSPWRWLTALFEKQMKDTLALLSLTGYTSSVGERCDGFVVC